MSGCGGVAILTSGGDAPGMNAAVRAVIRYLDHHSTPVYSVSEGYEGLCQGGDMIRQMGWLDVMGIMSRGGTLIGTARCAAFRTRPGRKSAVRNLVERGINCLVVIGGDGSLTGASIFKTEWPELVAELVEEGLVSGECALACSHLNIVGMVGSIDNDLCGTDMTIGADTALHRIMDAIDCLASTAASHMRTFIVEVMGRHCGYLALISAIAAPCDWLFIPESPPEPGWEEEIVTTMQCASSSSKRFGLIILAEGAQDAAGTPIKADQVKGLLCEVGMDVRVTVLGHVQRGGKPTAFDRTLGSRLGCEAAKVALEGLSSNTEIPPCIVSLKNNKIIRLPLMEAIRHTQRVKECVDNLDFQRAQELRGPGFHKRVNMTYILSVLERKPLPEGAKKLNIGVACIGAPAAGMNSGIRALVKIAAYHGNQVTVFYEGIDGLLGDHYSVPDPDQTELWSMQGGCLIGATRTTVSSGNLDQVLEKIQERQLDCLVLFGGFEAVTSCIALTERPVIPVYLIPATISNNVPGSDFSIGCDTSLNTIVQAIDVIKQSAASTRKRVFIIDVMGGNCGYLAVLSGLASGADAVYIPEREVNIDELQHDALRVMDKIDQGIHRGIIIRNENSSPHYKNEFVSALYAQEGKNKFVTRSCVLGHLQQGYSPSPFDRCLAASFACKVYKDVVKRAARPCTSADVVVLGVRGSSTVFSPVLSLPMDVKRRVPTQNWWLELAPLIPTLALPPQRGAKRDREQQE